MADPKLMLSMLLCGLMTSEVDVGYMVVETEFSQQYSITFYCHVTDDSIGAI